MDARTASLARGASPRASPLGCWQTTLTAVSATLRNEMAATKLGLLEQPHPCPAPRATVTTLIIC